MNDGVATFRSKSTSHHVVDQTLHAGSGVLPWTTNYKMDSNPRGLALIINNENFSKGSEPRHGSSKDVDDLKKVLKELYFEVEERFDLKLSKMKKELEKFSQDVRHERADICIVVIMSHGTLKGIKCADDAVLEYKSILESFNNIKCPMLKGKPKFFIFQSCRGTEYNFQPLDEEHTDTQAFQHPEDREVEVGYDPAWEDMLVAYATIEGFVSFRNKIHGSWFIQCLCDVLEKNARQGVCLRDMLDMVAFQLKSCQGRAVRTSKSLLCVQKQEQEIVTKQSCCYLVIHLYKKIRFD